MVIRLVDSGDVEMLQSIMEGAGIESFNYSGRSMDGQECVAIRVSEDQNQFHVIADLVDATGGDIEQVDILTHALRGVRSDQLGKGTVLYFPQYQN